MKKLVGFLGIICIVLTITILILSKFYNNADAFPHFKQAAMQYKGTVYTMIDKEFQISFNFIDESKFSEMAQKDNIKEIYIIDESEKKILVNSWEITSSPFDDFSIRNIHAKVIFNEKNNCILNKLIIKYRDDVVEEFDIGSFKVVVSTNYYDNPYVFNVSQSLIPALDSTYGNFSGILISLGKLDVDKIQLTNIDLGIEGFGVDDDNIKIIRDNEISMGNFIDELNSSKAVKEIDTQITPLNIDFNDNSVITLLIPITVQMGKEKDSNIFVFNPVLTFDIDGEIYKLCGDVNLISTPSVSNGNFKGEIDPEEYIREFGI